MSTINGLVSIVIAAIYFYWEVIGNKEPGLSLIIFFDKATYSYLALSFYNLIPGCSIWNSNLKRSNLFNVEENSSIDRRIFRRHTFFYSSKKYRFREW
ncbi:MAG TPA: hypothetical protein DIT10_20270 [Chryseobacterium sp.]|nr:hypothetical protein [Chryseobacterium sp.]